jgi:formylglycine-generating enzyme required for sulfatase activity
VGRYSPDGDGPYGCVDVAGNVWEWTSSKEGESSRLRGGSWNDLRNFARCAYRNWILPANWNNYIGFRCARSC